MNSTFKALSLAALLSLAPCALQAATQGGTFTTGKQTFLLDGKPFIVKAAELHYPRIPRPYWEHRIKLCKSLGMNTICLYVFWNIHEPTEGAFDFTGQNDVAEFCRLCQKHGLYVIVRPGPYVCAEWEMGGLPWWLLKKKDIRLREPAPYFMERVRLFELEVGRQLAPLTIQNGGPIIMVQVENEYGSYGEDKQYVSEIRDIVRESGFDRVTLFQCDWASNFTRNGLDDLVWTMNFGTGANIDEQFRRLGELRPDAPRMCSEFWSGWFDKWGARHETRPSSDMVAGIDQMLSRGISFSLYMTHGGTSFGHWAGANSPGFQPDVTSYDYDAPINEYGQPTPKFYELRQTLQRYNGGKPLPKVPRSPMPIVSVPQFALTEYAPLAQGTGNTRESRTPLTFEDLDMGFGTAVYTTTLPALPEPSVLTGDFHDFAQVFVNHQYVGQIDRVKNERSLQLPALPEGGELTIVVEGMWRINFGRAIKDYKGIIGDPTITTEHDGCELQITPRQWTNETIPDTYERALSALSRPQSRVRGLATKAGYYRGHFNIKKVGDTFLNLEAFGKGQVYVNGHALGRFWSIGPQQTLYVPGCWLKRGQNEVVVLDVVGPKAEPTAFCQDHPELNKLCLQQSDKHNNPGDRPDLNSQVPVAEGQLPAVGGWQHISFSAPASGRYLALECLSACDGGSQVALAELYAIGADGKRLPREGWTVKYADSENTLQGNHTGDKAFDLQESTYWQTQKGDALPHLLVIDLGQVEQLSGIDCLPRAEQGAPGSIQNFRFYLQ